MDFSNWLGASERTWLPLSLLSYSHSCSYTLIPESKEVSNIDSSKWPTTGQKSVPSSQCGHFHSSPHPWHVSLDLHVSGLACGFCHYSENGTGWLSTALWRHHRKTDSLDQTALEVFLSRTCFLAKNKHTELQVCKWCACVHRKGNIYCTTQCADMKLEDTLFRVAIVRLHTILSHKQGLISHAAGLCRSCFGYKSVIFKVFRIDITLDNSPLGISNRSFAWNTNVDRQTSKEFVFLVNENIWCCYSGRDWKETCALSTTVVGLNSVSNMNKDYVYRPASISGFIGYRSLCA